MGDEIVDNAEARRFEIYSDDKRAGLVGYRLNGSEIAFLHTEIDPGFNGRGLGSKVARHVLDDARERGLSVLPYCPFIGGWIGRHPEYRDLVPADKQEELVSGAS